MKKSTFLLDENLLGRPQNPFNPWRKLENQDFLLFIYSIDKKTVSAVNYRASVYFDSSFPTGLPARHLFEAVIHPEDYGLFYHFLLDIPHSENEALYIRFRSPFGYWKKFELKTRIYNGAPETEEKQILICASAIDMVGRSKMSSGNLEVEKHLQESLDRYNTLLSSLDHGFMLIEMIYDLEQKPLDFLIVEVNGSFVKHVPVKEPVGKTMKELLPDHGHNWFLSYGEVATTGNAMRFEQYAGDLEAWYDVYAFPLGSRKSRSVGVLCTDITTRKKSEISLKKLNENLEYQVKKRTAELRENNELLQMIFDTVNQGIFLLKPRFGSNYDIRDFTYVRANRKISRYYRRGSLVGQSFLGLNPDAAKSGVFETLKQTMLTGKSANFEVCLEHEGKKNWLKIITHRQRGMLINSLENITREKERSRAFNDNLRFKKQLIETTPDLIAIFNLHQENIRFVNRDLDPSIGMTRKKLLNMPLVDLLPQIHPEDRQKVMEFHRKLRSASDRDIVEVEFRLKSRSRAWECYNARGKVFIRSKTGKVSEYIILLRNVQEQKLTQQALVTAEKLSIKGEIARTLAHELRNPMTSIGMSADILSQRMKEKKQDDLDNYIHIIKRSTTTLNELVNDLLNSANYSPFKFQKCCLASITSKALSMAQDRIYLAGIRIEKNYSSPCYINGDEEKLRIALLNIILNASEAMEPDQGVLRLDITRNDNMFILRVTDNGCGIAEDQLEHLFESFYTRKPGGLGVGLSSVKSIMEEHGASIQVRSQLNEGSTFIISFPCYEDHQGKKHNPIP